MLFMLGTKDEAMTLSNDDSQKLHWYIDAALGVHLGMKSCTGDAFIWFLDPCRHVQPRKR